MNSAHSSVAFALVPPAAGLALAAADEKIPARAAEIHAPRVLVVDDEPLVRWSLGETLSKAGYDVMEAGTSRDARAALGDPDQRIAAIVLDLKLPDGQGLDVLEDARRANRFCPAVLITAYGTPEVVDRARTLGAVAIIPKPFDLEYLLAVLTRACPPRG